MEPADGGWAVTTRGRGGASTTERYRAVLVANGHHWDPRWPEPAFPGAEKFPGEQLHAHNYREPDVLRGKRVLVLGIGNSATDIAVESSRIAEHTYLAMRRGAHIVPKYIFGKPIDQVADPVHGRGCRCRCSASSRCGARHRRRHMTDYGLPKPDHKVFRPTRRSPRTCSPGSATATSPSSPTSTASTAAARSASSTAAGGDRPRRLLHRLQDDLPVPRPEGARGAGQPADLYRRVVSVERPGCTSSASSSRWARSCRSPRRSANGSPTCSAGRATLPAAGEMKREIASEERKMRKRFVSSKRHTVEVDFHPYLREIRRERKRAAQPA